MTQEPGQTSSPTKLPLEVRVDEYAHFVEHAGPLSATNSRSNRSSNAWTGFCRGVKFSVIAGFVANMSLAVLMTAVGTLGSGSGFFAGGGTTASLIPAIALFIAYGTPVVLFLGLIFGGGIGALLGAVDAQRHAPAVAALVGAALPMCFVGASDNDNVFASLAIVAVFLALVGALAGYLFARSYRDLS